MKNLKAIQKKNNLVELFHNGIKVNECQFGYEVENVLVTTKDTDYVAIHTWTNTSGMHETTCSKKEVVKESKFHIAWEFTSFMHENQIKIKCLRQN